MDFCQTCGILLPENFGQQFSKCKPCQSDWSQKPSEVCDCELCCYRDESGSVVKRSDIISSFIFRDQNSAGTNLKTNQCKSHSQEFFYLPLVAEKAVTKKGHLNSEQLKLSSRYELLPMETDSLGEKPSNKLEDWGDVAHPVSYSVQANEELLMNETSDWGMAAPLSDTEDFGWDVMEQGDNDELDGWKKVEDKKGRKEYHLLEEVRLKWEREQEAYRRQLSQQDTPAVSALVGGQRRKEDGGRFYIAGVDISFIKGNNVDACACLSVLRMPDLKLVYQRMQMVELTEPYIPGFLAFREIPPLAPLFERLRSVAPQYWPDLTFVDGNGVLHPRGCGLACQLGVVLGIPTAGVAKSLISAQGIEEDQEHKKKKRGLKGAGDGFDLISDSGTVLGKCIQIHDKAPNPVYISAGHQVSLSSASWIALECSKFRIPEPVRRADLDSREYLRQGTTEPQEFILPVEENL